jgi:riboflavin synthase alpha subunit
MAVYQETKLNKLLQNKGNVAVGGISLGVGVYGLS